MVMEKLQVLADEQLSRLEAVSLQVLERVGVKVPHEEMLRRFDDAGAKVDFGAQRVRIPPDLVWKCLSQAGKRFTLRGRDPLRCAPFGQGERNYNSSFGQALWIDAATGQRRYPTLDDVRAATRLGDALDQIHIVGAMADPHELPISYRCVVVASEMIRNTTKPIGLWFHDRASARYLIEMFRASGPGPLGYPFLEPISPLQFPFHGVDLLFETCTVPLPVPIGPMAQVGMSAPGTLAGAMAQEHAEILAGICITQLIRPGTPVCYGGIPHAFDMATTQLVFAGPEQILMSVALTQLAKRHGLPVYINAGLTDSKCVDAQAGLESGMTLLAGVLAGADIFGHLGICGADQGGSLDMLVLQNEIVGYIERVCRGIEISDEALGLDVIEEVIFRPGATFIDHEHTVRYFRQELWFPRLLDRRFYQAWMESGAGNCGDRCREQRDQIMDCHTPEPVSSELDRELARIVSAAKRDLHKP
jgi:trimethylamine---corrinoid protein Co-methyltransferase